MTRAFRLRTGVILLGVVAILTLWPTLVNAMPSDYVWMDFCQCWIYVGPV